MKNFTTALLLATSIAACATEPVAKEGFSTTVIDRSIVYLNGKLKGIKYTNYEGEEIEELPAVKVEICDSVGSHYCYLDFVKPLWIKEGMYILDFDVVAMHQLQTATHLRVLGEYINVIEQARIEPK